FYTTPLPVLETQLRHSIMKSSIRAVSLLLAVTACRPAASDTPSRDLPTLGARQAPTGAMIDPAGRTFDVGSFPLNLIPAPEPDLAVLVLSGWREQGIQVVRPATGEIVQTLLAPAA